LVHGNIHDDFLQFARSTGRENLPASASESCGKALDLS
jgi:hypothetical protein